MRRAAAGSRIFRLLLCAAAGWSLWPAPSAHAFDSADRSAAAHGPAAMATMATMERAEDEAAARGLLAQIPDGVIRDGAGQIVWDRRPFAFLAQPAPPATVDPALWRQARRNARHGLFEVVPGAVWQVRGYDISVMTIIRGKTGWIVVDPLTVTETAKAAFDLVQATLGERPVSAILFTHSHVDHFGGVFGVADAREIRDRNLPIVAPAGFAEESWRENLLAGHAMQRRAAYMFGTNLPIDAANFVDNGIGPGLPGGTSNFLAPTIAIGPGERRIDIDGVTFDFIDISGTEAPAEFAFLLPQWHAVHTAELATKTMHHLLTPRGAQIRDALRWSEALDHIYRRCLAACEVQLASHGWPTFGRDRVRSFLAAQRDSYKYLHDQVLGAANEGRTMHEIAADLDGRVALIHPSVAGLYGDVRHNARAVYQRYFGWWDGVPANLDPLPPADLAARYVALAGGADAVLAKARQALEADDLRWAAQLLNDLVFADAGGAEARAMLGAAYRRLGTRAASAAIRNYYLSAAAELDGGEPLAAISGGRPSADFIAAIPLSGHLELLATRYIAQAHGAPVLSLAIIATDTGEKTAIEARPIAEIVRPDGDLPADAIRIAGGKMALLRLFAGGSLTDAVASGEIAIAGDAGAAAIWLARHRPVPGSFAVALP